MFEFCFEIVSRCPLVITVYVAHVPFLHIDTPMRHCRVMACAVLLPICYINVAMMLSDTVATKYLVLI